ncbi:small-conductance mechanosensitive channel [Xenococcus sp. PCC 7305]|uniref:mechanosensitive ion channel domain-containing protein n=1 Tax=Xenococcus sp. PCC 7305 TaxID=102125 RepID=UPI0002ABAE30|nr:mechanosensitive ion channel domain-containing protein [Xenococcus sp. PCC 7305]ELS03621.1 small-conductance mechanosensitive channel [Xenococcus sp. PCC 7305]
MKRSILISGIVIVSFSWLPTPVRAQSAEANSPAITIADPSIPERELELMVKPLTQDELEIEANAWLDLLKVQVKEVSDAEIAVNRKNEELDETKEAVKDLKEAEEALIEVEETTEENATNPITEETRQELEEDLDKAQDKLEEAQESIEEAIEEEAKTLENEELAEALTEAQEDAAKEEQAEAAATEGQSELPTTQEEKELLEETVAETAEELTELETATIDDTQEIEQAQQQIEQTTEKLEAAIEDKADIKTQLLLNLTEARDKQAALGNRFEVIINELEKKGGEVEAYQKYLAAVGLIKLDVSDRQALWITLLGWLKSETGGLLWAINISKFVGIAVFSVAGSFAAANVTRRSLQIIPNMSELLRGFLVGIVRQGTLVIGILFALTALGISLGPLLAVFGGVSFVLAFALQNNLGNLASGLMIMFYKPFDEGDEIKVDDLWGYVDSISIASTKIKGMSGEVISVPNDSIWNSNIINLTYTESRGFSGTIVVDLEQNLSQAKQVILEAIQSHPQVLSEPAPRTLIWELDGDAISIMFFGHIKTKEYWQVHEEVIELIQKGINNAEIAIDIPEQRIQIESLDKNLEKNGEKSHDFSKTLPTESLKKN